MTRLRTLIARVLGLLRRESVINNIEKEFRLDIEMETERLIERGVNPDVARALASKSFGNVGLMKDAAYQVRGGGMLEAAWQDIRFGARMLIKSPAFTTVAVLTLALGIGANAAIFSLVDAVLLRPLPYYQPEQLIILKHSQEQKGLQAFPLSQSDFALYRDQNHVFSQIAGYANTGFNLTGAGDAERMAGTAVTGDLFGVLGVKPILGRTFRPDEDMPGRNAVCILSYGLWQNRFGSDPNIIGTSLTLNDIPTEVVGVMPRGFSFPDVGTAAWTPFGLNPQRRKPAFLTAVARLKPGVLVSEAQSETSTLLLNDARQSDQQSNIIGLKTTITLLKDQITGDMKKPLLVLLVAVGFVLLIACANVANLLLSRDTTRTREIGRSLCAGSDERTRDTTASH